MVVLSQASQNRRERTDPRGPSPYSYDSVGSGSVLSSPTEKLTQPFRVTGRAWDAEVGETVLCRIFRVRAQKSVIPLIVILMLNTPAAYGQGNRPITFVVRAEQPGWQGAVCWVEKGVPVEVRASGNWTMNVNVPKMRYVGPEGYNNKHGEFRLGALILQIGCHTDDLSRKENPKRLPVVVERHAVPGQLVVTPQHGGLVYFYVNDVQDPPAWNNFNDNAGEMQVTIVGALRVAVIGKGSSVLRGWPKSVAGITAPWGEFHGGHVILTLPIEQMRQVKDPASVMEWFDTLYLHYCDLDGRLPSARKERFVPDVELSRGLAHAGYPIMYTASPMRPPSQGDIVQLEANLARDAAGQSDGASLATARNTWAFMHELGHNFQREDYTFEGTLEVTNNIFVLYASDKMDLKHVMDHVVNGPGGHYGSRRLGFSKSLDYMASGAKFDDWKKDQCLALYFYTELIDEFGWDALKRMFRVYWSLPSDQRPRNNDEKRDLFLIVMSRCTNCNLAPFMDRWGIPISLKARAAVSRLRPWSGPAAAVEPPPPATQ